MISGRILYNVSKCLLSLEGDNSVVIGMNVSHNPAEPFIDINEEMQSSLTSLSNDQQWRQEQGFFTPIIIFIAKNTLSFAFKGSEIAFFLRCVQIRVEN